MKIIRQSFAKFGIVFGGIYPFRDGFFYLRQINRPGKSLFLKRGQNFIFDDRRNVVISFDLAIIGGIIGVAGGVSYYHCKIYIVKVKIFQSVFQRLAIEQDEHNINFLHNITSKIFNTPKPTNRSARRRFFCKRIHSPTCRYP